MSTSPIVILDFGSQYTQLIARRVREFNVFSVVLPCTIGIDQIRALMPSGLILSGGPASVYDPEAPAADPVILDLDLPILGICYGLQFMVHHLGGSVVPSSHREYGHALVEVVEESPLFRGLPGELDVWMSHGDHARTLPEGFRVTATTAKATAAMANEQRRMWAVQFHPEVAHTRHGTEAAAELCFRFVQCAAGLDAGTICSGNDCAGARAGWRDGACVVAGCLEALTRVWQRSWWRVRSEID